MDDNETVEMIAQKFAVLDNYYKSKKKEDESKDTSELTEKEMEEVFNITSSFKIPDVVDIEVNNDDDEYEISGEEEMNDEYVFLQIQSSF